MMAKDAEHFAKGKAREVEESVEGGIDDAARGLRKKGIEIQEYLKKVHAEVEEWKFGVEESKDGYRVEWRVVALIRKPTKR